MPNKRLQRVISYYNFKRQFKKKCVSSLIKDHGPSDPRLFVNVEIGSKKFEALLDSGASVSVLGKGALEFLEREGLKFRKMFSHIKTADGTSNQIVGYINLPVKIESRSENILFCIVPSLKESVYLGIDFWRIFEIIPKLVIDELESKTLLDDKTHALSLEQQNQLDKIKVMFPSFNELGLGKTDLHEHEIEIIPGAKPQKQRYYAISPAVQKDLYAELDRMISLDVIEECNYSPWSSPVTLVRKSNGKVRLCLDARKVNSVTVKDAYPLPLIDGLLGRLHDTKFITSLDLKDAFWQIRTALKGFAK